jgi:hypothetical protein
MHWSLLSFWSNQLCQYGVKFVCFRLSQPPSSDTDMMSDAGIHCVVCACVHILGYILLACRTQFLSYCQCCLTWKNLGSYWALTLPSMNPNSCLFMVLLLKYAVRFQKWLVSL